jgi:solute:Na+ symporter, SSS family
MSQTSAEAIAATVPAGWDDLFFGWRLDLDWSGLLSELNRKIYSAPPVGDGYSLFGLFVMMLLFKGLLVSMAGPTPNYAIQHVLSTRSPREAALENMCMAVVSLGPRFLLIAGIAVLGLVFFSPELAAMGTKVDFEQILPNVLNNYVPFGLKGVIIAGLLAAFMSTAVSTVNSGAAYVVNDIYKRYINADAPPKRYVHLAYIVSALVILVGVAFGFWTQSIQRITEWIVSALLVAFVAPNVLKWHWWRFNGYGFFAGMAVGTAAAVAVPLVLPQLPGAYDLSLGSMQIAEFTVPQLTPLHAFPFIMALSTIASVVVCLLTPPEGDEILKSFYRQVRPWGFWKPIYEKLRREHPEFEKNRDFGRDVFNVIVGMFWQTSMVTLPIYLVIQQFRPMWISLAVLVITSAILKFTWYDRLGPGEMYMPDDR